MIDVINIVDGQEMPGTRLTNQELVQRILEPGTRRVILKTNGKKIREYRRQTCAVRFAWTERARDFLWVIIGGDSGVDWSLR